MKTNWNKISKIPKFNHEKIDVYKNKKCLTQGCKNKPVACHSISKAQIELIQENGHALHYGLYGQKKEQFVEPNKKQVTLQKIGINEVSIFNGFCNSCDNQLFKKIDKEIFEENTGSIFLNNLRAISYRNIITKKAHQAHLKNSNEVAPFYKQIDKNAMRELLNIGHTALSLDLPHQLNKYQMVLSNKKYDLLEYAILSFSNDIWFLGNDVTNLICDIEFNEFQTINPANSRNLLFHSANNNRRSNCL